VAIISNEHAMKDETIKNAPASPGVYLMKDRSGGIIYVGKAGNLKNRIRAYTSGTDSRYMVPFLVSRIHEVDYILTQTEKEALILENNLIKEHRPRYNVNLRDDKTYFSIRIDPADPFPRFQLVRHPKQDGARYFGPYPSSISAKETLRFLQRVFPLRTCRDQELNTRKRPCLEYEIKRCMAPCVGMVDGPSYRRMVKDSMALLEGREKKLIHNLRTRMKDASAQMHFEEAAAFRDQIAAIEETVEKQSVMSTKLMDRDVFGLYREGSLVQVCIIYIRKGRVLEREIFPLLKSDADNSEILSSIVKQYYDRGVHIPEGILLPYEVDDRKVIADWLTEKSAKKVSLSVPMRGRGLEVVKIAQDNAKNAFTTAEEKSDHQDEILDTVAKILQLKNRPIHMECFDISNIGGSYAVGSMVTFMAGMPWKAGYRRFRIRTVDGADDYAMMYEVMKRRYRGAENLPDLIVADGGKGQLGVAVSVLKDLGLEKIDVIGMAKAKPSLGKGYTEDRLYLPRRKNPIYLSKWPSVLFLFQRIRDEAHRFAVTYHRKLRNKRDLQSELDNIPGIGRVSKKALLKYFGDIQRIRDASVESLQDVTGIGRERAFDIVNYFKGRNGVEGI
jgi:excinuclease ABC subunit C